jgi:spore germination protein YaaH
MEPIRILVLGILICIGFLASCNKSEKNPDKATVDNTQPEITPDEHRPLGDSSNIHLISTHAGLKVENDKISHLSDEEIDKIQGVSHAGKHRGDFEKHPDYKVFGWHMPGGTRYKSYNYSILWGLGFFDYEIDPATGKYTNPDAIRRWRTSAIVDSCKAHGTKVFLTVTNFTHSKNKQFLTNAAAQQTLIDSMIVLLKARQADGISVDFETVYTTRSWSGDNYRAENKILSDSVTNFFAKVKKAFDQENKGWLISIALPASDGSGIFNIPELTKSIDYFMIMGYDYWYAGSPTTGPVSPLRIHPGHSSLSLERSVFHYLGKNEEGKQVNTGVPPKRLILALPYYSRSWGAESDKEHAKTTGKDRHAPSYTMIKRDDYAKEAEMDTFGITKFKNIKGSDGTISQVWFDDAETLGHKIDFIKSEGIGGMGIWALGDDNGYTELWEMLVEKFGK